MDTEIELPDGSITFGKVLDLLLSLPKDRRNDIVRHLMVLAQK